MNLKKALKIDPQAEVEGVWIDFDGFPGVRLKIARNNNLKHRRWMQEEMRPMLRRYGGADKIPLEEMESISRKGRAQFILLDWDGVDEEEGKPLPYSYEKGLEYLSTMPDLDEFVASKSLEFENFRAKQVEDEQKNSVTSSAGSWSTEGAFVNSSSGKKKASSENAPLLS